MTEFKREDSLGALSPEDQEKYLQSLTSQPKSESYILFSTVYGSKLYGTSTPTSDTDNKVVYVPALDDLLLGNKLKIYKKRFDAEGNPVGNSVTMPDGGIETEYFPVHTFVRDFVDGQTYALEMAFAYLSYGPPKHSFGYTIEKPTYDFVREMVEKFSNAEVYSMVSFAMKQTFDYVKRGERLNDARKVLAAIDEVQSSTVPLVAHGGHEARLDWELDGEMVLDHIAHLADLKTDVQNGGNKPQRSLEMNGRSYLESTTLAHLRIQVEKQIASFGDRSTAAADTKVEHKSRSHAIRVYQQAIELLDTGTITFPRPNAEFLLKVKEGREDPELVKQLLLDLDDEVQTKILTSTMRKKTPELQAAAEEWLLEQLHGFYDFELGDDA